MSSNLRKDADELLRLATLTESEYVKRFLTSEATKLVQLAENAEKLKAETPRSADRHIAATSSKLTNYGWDQSDKFVKIYVDFKGVHNFSATSVNSQFEDRLFDLHIFDEAKKSNYVLTIKNLLNPIVASASYVKVKTDLVIVFLKKTTSSHWEFITETEKKAKDVKAPKPDKDEDPGANLMNLMKKMYDDGDDDMKRTIAKAWTEARDKKSPEDM